MKIITLILAASLLTACAIAPGPTEGATAVSKYVADSRLTAVPSIRTRSGLRFTQLDDYFVLIPVRSGVYLAEFLGGCPELTDPVFRPDMIDPRHDPEQLSVNVDTIRGCQIKALYEVDNEQVAELYELADELLDSQPHSDPS